MLLIKSHVFKSTRFMKYTLIFIVINKICVIFYWLLFFGKVVNSIVHKNQPLDTVISKISLICILILF